jgi:hypothetical protein
MAGVGVLLWVWNFAFLFVGVAWTLGEDGGPKAWATGLLLAGAPLAALGLALCLRRPRSPWAAVLNAVLLLSYVASWSAGRLQGRQEDRSEDVEVRFKEQRP